MNATLSNAWLLFAYILLPLASPFGVGIHAGTANPSRQSPNQFSTSIKSIPMPPTSAASQRTLMSMQQKDNAEMKNGVTTNEAISNRREKKNVAVRILSRLLYTYVDPLLKAASKRPLQESDVFTSQQSVKMDNQVTKLENIYSRCKEKSRNLNLQSSMNKRKNGSFKKKLNTKVAQSEALILAKSLMLHQKNNIIRTGLLRLLNTGIQAFPAILVARLLRLIEAGNAAHPSQAMRAAFELVAVLTIKMIVENQYFHSIVLCSTMVRGSLSGMIFDKSLKVSSSTNQDTIHGEKEDGSKEKDKSNVESSSVLNLVQSDVALIENTALQIHTVWDGILQMGIYSTLLYKYLGKSVFWGIAVLFMTIPTNALCLRILDRLGKLELKAKDVRTKKTNEAIMNMKLLKLNAWENHFKRGIEDARKEELMRHMNRGAFRALNQAISNAVPAIVLVVTLTAYRKSGRPIVASTIFTAISLFNQLRFPLLFYPLVIDAIANGKNALGRLSSYLSQEDLTQYVQTIPKSPAEGGNLKLKNGNFLWGKPSSSSSNGAIETPALCNANIEVKAGEIIAVVGSVGAGKSALVKALLGELEPVPRLMVDASMGQSIDAPTRSAADDIASVTTKGTVAYCPQEAWLPKGSIRDAVLFGREYDEKRYLAAIYDAVLDEDINSGTLSHDTDVGEGGTSLSGGQRARVQLARALYGESTGVFLLDDPLSALDAAVGSTVFDRITKRMREKKAAVIFVTNDVSLPRRCDRVILMEKTNTGLASTASCSYIEDTGTYDELLSRGHDLSSITVHSSASESDPDQTNNESEMDDAGDNYSIDDNSHTDSNVELLIDMEPVEKHNLQDSPASVIKLSNATDFVDEEEVNEKKTKDQISTATTLDDKMTKGAVPLSTYITYFKSVKSPLLIASTLACFLSANGAQFFQQYTVAKWTELGKGASSALGGKYLQSLVYAAGVVSVFLWLRSFLLMRVGVKASEFIHSRMLNSVFNSPVTFFDSTPSGQLLSRFGQELETVDRSVPDGIGSVLFCFLNIAITAAGLTGLMTPGMIFPLAFMAFFYQGTMAKFRPTARDLKRFASKSRSPIFTQFGEALKGVETIRSFPNSSIRWSSDLRSRIDNNLDVIYTMKALDRWLSIRLESLGNIIVLTAAFVSVVLTRTGRMKSGSAGWGLTQSLAITGLLTWAVRALTDYESAMMSVIRINEIAGLDDSSMRENNSSPSSIPQEKAKTGEALEALFSDRKKSALLLSPQNDEALVASGWPWKGAISFKNVSMRYNPSSDLALKHVNLEIPAGTTLGVVGRTGSGKSTLLVTLFRLVEIESAGTITIDGVDLRSVSLSILRRSLSIIPQDPVLFEGTLSYNLDATRNASKDDMWKALETASPTMYAQYRASEYGLDSMISESGKNLSAGQRQLICLARALLRNSKILVLDEATSSVDPKTDSQIQDTIQREFVKKGVSVITVAHRLDTVLGSDKIAVLGNGEMVEYGNPNELLTDRNGELRRLVDADNRNKRKGANILKESELIIVD